MKIIRFEHNPLFSPKTLKPSREDVRVDCVLNPGAFEYQGRIGLILRVAESPRCGEGEVGTLLLDRSGEVVPWIVSRQDSRVRQVDSRAFFFDDKVYLTSMSHFLVVWSSDGEHFTLEDSVTIFPQTELEAYGIEDARVCLIEDEFIITYTAVSANGIAVGMMKTRNWHDFYGRTVMMPPSNKDCVLFPRKINGLYYCFHRPGMGGDLSPLYIWSAESPDLVHWGDHHLVAQTREGCWDSSRIGAGASPLEVEEGWLHIYHGVDTHGQYCLASLLTKLDEPWKVIGRSSEPFMIPEMEYEKKGFYSGCIFTNGYIRHGDKLLMYYGASDTVVAGALIRVSELLDTLRSV